MNISKNILGWLFIGLIFCRLSPAANQITITTYYPSPYGVYKELRLNPIPTASQPPCNDNLKGTMYYDKNKDTLYVCSKDPASGNTGWIPVPGGDNLYWVLNDSDDIYNINSSGSVGINTTGINPLSGIFVVSHDGTTEDLVVDENNGNVGIGTTSPSYKLDVASTMRVRDVFGAGGKNLVIGDDAYLTDIDTANMLGVYGMQNSDRAGIRLGSDGGYIFGDNGNVGIGTTDPMGELDVNGKNIVLRGGTRKWVIHNSGGFTLAPRNNADTGWLWNGGLRIDSNTLNVGIGTTSPAYKLDVNGDIRAIGSVYYGGTVGNADGTAYTKPDYVFEEGYKVMKTEEVEQFLKKEGHLPWMTSVKQEKKENGKAVNMTRMAFETVETVENLQLQLIMLNRVVKKQQREIEELKKQIERMR